MPDARNDRSLSWLPIAGAAAVAAVALIIVIIVGSGRDQRVGLKEDANGALVCPPTYQQKAVQDVTMVPRAWVPFRPTGIDGSADLVPKTKPTRVTVCRYPSVGTSLTRTTQVRLGGSKVLTSGLTAMTTSLSKAPRAGSPTSGPCSGPTTTYMIGFRFATGVVWVTLPGTGCQRITNGVWDTTVSIQDQVEAAFESGAWR